jgi:hypothetical protein
MYLRKAAEACAIAARVQKHPHLADTWSHAVQGEVCYQKFHEKFKALFPPNDPVLHEVFEFYDHSSKILHGSPLYLGGHVILQRPSPSSLDMDFNAFDATKKLTAALNSLEAKLAAQRLEWHARFPDGGGW